MKNILILGSSAGMGIEKSFKEVFPQLPVIAIILPDEFSLTLLEVFVKKLRLLGTLICFDIFSDFLTLFITAKDAPLSKASFK